MTRRSVLGATAAAGLAGAGVLAWRQASARPADHADLAYGSDARQRLDIYWPAGAGPFPYVIDIHGGAFRAGDKTMSGPSATLLDAGIAIVRPNYRLSGTDLWPAQGEDCLAAVRYLADGGAAWGLHPARMALWGQSAGAFLAVSTALSLIEAGQPPRAVAGFFGPMDFSTMDADMATLGRTPSMGATNAADSPESQLLGFTVGDDPAAARAVGPVGRLAAMAPRTLTPLFLRHGDADALIAHLQSERLATAWRAVDPTAVVDLAVVPGAGHGGDAFDSDAVMAPLRDFLLAAFA